MRAVNLIPSEQRGGQSVGAGRSEGAAYAVLGLLAAIAVLAVLYGKAHRDISSKEAQTVKLTAEASRAQSEASSLAPYTSFVALRQQREQAVSALVDSRFDWAHAFHEFGRVLTGQTSISSLNGQITGAGTTTSASSASSSVTSATPPGSVPTFTLDGCATSQTAVAVMLQRLRLIDGVASVTLQSSAKASGGSSAGGGGSSGAGACPANDPSFVVGVNFDPLPSTSAEQAAAQPAAKNVSDAGGGSE